MENASHKRHTRSSIDADNTRVVRDLVEDADFIITVAEIASEMGISVGRVHTILLDELGFSRIQQSLGKVGPTSTRCV